MWENRILWTVVLGVYLVGSLGYIAFDQWNDYKMQMQNAQIEQVYNQGTTDTVRKLIEEASKCQPVEVFAGEDKITLKAVECENGVLKTTKTAITPAE